MDSRTVYLQRVDPAKNEARFYWLHLGPSLVDDCAVMRMWGRIGGHQHRMVTAFQLEAEAQKLFDILVRRRLRGGYTLVAPEQESVKL